jgi:hypothetical protein
MGGRCSVGRRADAAHDTGGSRVVATGSMEKNGKKGSELMGRGGLVGWAMWKRKETRGLGLLDRFWPKARR